MQASIAQEFVAAVMGMTNGEINDMIEANSPTAVWYNQATVAEHSGESCYPQEITFQDGSVLSVRNWFDPEETPKFVIDLSPVNE